MARPPAVQNPNDPYRYFKFPDDIGPTSRELERMRRWIVRAYPDLKIPRLSETMFLDPRLRPGVRASSSARDRTVRIYDDRLATSLDYLGRGGPYRNGLQNDISTGLHELLHQEGPRYGNTPRDRFWEEGLAEYVASDMGPGYAGTKKYMPTPRRKFEDGSYSGPERDFQFRPDTYPKQVEALKQLSFIQALLQMAPGWEGLEDPSDSPEAMRFRRQLLGMTAKGRQAKVRKVKKAAAAQRRDPKYLPKTARSVGRAVRAAANIPRDPIAAAAQQVGRSTREAGRSTPDAVKRRVRSTPKAKRRGVGGVGGLFR